MIAGKTDPTILADLACGIGRRKTPLLEKALQGRVNGHHRYLLKLWMGRLRELETDIA